MIRLGAEMCLAFHRAISASKGAKDCVRRALEAGIPTYLIDSYTYSRKFLPVGGTGLQSRVHVENEVIPLTEIVPRAPAGAEISWNAY